MGIIEGATVVLLSAIGGCLGGFLGAYMKKKGENIATKEDIAELTHRAKEIEAKIDDQMWNRQRQWELKRDAVIGVVQALYAFQDALIEYGSLYKVWLADPWDQRSQAIRDRAMFEWKESKKEFEEKHAIALLLCGENLNEKLRKARSEIRSGALMILEEKLRSDEDISAMIRPMVQAAISEARKELGLSTDES